MNKKTFAKLFALVLAVCVVFSLAVVVASAADEKLLATFTLGNDGTASHHDGSSKTTYTETADDYTLSITGGTNMYTGARDATGQACIKFGTGSAAGSMTFTVPDEVTSVKIYVAAYKANTATVTINDVATALTCKSNNGEYDVITVDTTATSVVSFAVTSGKRAMLNTIEFYGAAASESGCNHTGGTATCVELAKCELCGESYGKLADHTGGTATCVELAKCDVCGEGYGELAGHTGGTATCSALAKCDVCGEGYGRLADHTYVDGACSACGEALPDKVTLTFDDTSKRTTFSTSCQIWTENGITFANDKAGSTTNVADYAAPVRLYKSSTITITASANIWKVIFTANTTDYATELQSSIGSDVKVTVSDKVVTVVLDGTGNSFTATMGAQIRLDSVTVSYEEIICEHTDTTTVTKEATCHKDGSVTETCDACGYDVRSEIIYASHTIVDGVCSICSFVEAPEAGVAYKFGMYSTNKDAMYYINGSMSGYYYMATVTDIADGANVYLEETEGGYYLYTYVNRVKTYLNMTLSVDGTHVNPAYEATASTVYTIDDTYNTVCATINSSVKYFGTYDTYTTMGTTFASNTSYIGRFYATEQPADPKLESASVVLGTDLSMIFKATVPVGAPSITVEFNGETVEITDYTVVDDTTVTFKFAGIGPHQMALGMNITLKVDGVAVDTKENYSVEQNLNTIKNAEDATDALIALVNSVLIYANESENYLGNEEGVNADELANDVAANDATYTLENAEAFGFTAAGVNFDYVNKIYVKFFVEGEFTLTVNGTAVAVEATEDGYYKVYTDALTATQFADEFTFVITVGEETATLTFSVNAYAAAMKDNAEMGALAEALYAYGVNAKNYEA